jgi:FdrA protein
VGGAATLQALEALDRDPQTEVIVIVSKPPAPRVADRVLAAAHRCDTPAVTCFIGRDTLGAAAAAVLEELGTQAPESREWIGGARGRNGSLLGLFSGGTLRDDARAEMAASLGSRAAEIPMLDLGDDEYTRGRAHPMIDQRLRLDHLAGAGADRGVGVVMLDLVLGYGAHPDPASEMAPVVAGVVEAGAAVVVSLCGTGADPQGRDRQARALNDAGASVYLTNSAAARAAAGMIAP